MAYRHHYIKHDEDAFGNALYDFHLGRGGFEVMERDDGYLDVLDGPQHYFSEYHEWPEHHKEALTLVRGSVLDIGCGAGRHALHLQSRGIDVLGIDISPLAVEICRIRGLERVTELASTDVSRDLGVFDTVLLLSSNFGLLGSRDAGRELLEELYSCTTDQGRIIAEAIDLSIVSDRFHRLYFESNVAHGRMPGQFRIRIRYKTFATPWFNYLMADKDELLELVESTSWRVVRFIDSDSNTYIAVLEKAKL